MTNYDLQTISKKMLTDLFSISHDESLLIHKYRKQLPVITDVDGDEGFCVDARNLHKQLKVKTPFDKWGKRRLSDFEHDSDFSTFLSESTGGRKGNEFALTVDCAKQIAMMEKTEIGKNVRRYFVLCEKLVIRMARREIVRQSCKESSKRMITNLYGRVPEKKVIKVTQEMHAMICQVATGGRPSMWRRFVGVDNVRDYLQENAKSKDLTRYDAIASMASNLCAGREMTKSRIDEILKDCFGESKIYQNALTKNNYADFV